MPYKYFDPQNFPIDGYFADGHDPDTVELQFYNHMIQDHKVDNQFIKGTYTIPSLRWVESIENQVNTLHTEKRMTDSEHERATEWITIAKTLAPVTP